MWPENLPTMAILAAGIAPPAAGTSVFGIGILLELCYVHLNGDKCTIREHFMVTSAQVRAARALLNWTVRDLAEKSGVHRNTVTRIETEATTPGHSMAAVQTALESAGVEFIPENGGGAGVRLRKSPDRQLPNGEAGIIENNEM
jgi:DNA-binding XRE family transcriptional regulator